MTRYYGNSRRRGAVWIYTALGLGVWLGCAALVIDMGWRYYRRSEAQRAADAAALAGVAHLPDLSNTTGAEAWARWYAGKNGYDAATDNRVSIVVTPNPNGNTNRYKVYVSRLEPSFFASYFTKNRARVGAAATAEYVSKAPLNITGGGAYGAKGAVNLSVFGPYSYYNNGDPYDPLYLPLSTHAPDTTKPNPSHTGWNGYDYSFSIPSNYRSQFGTYDCTVEVYDPDCYNKNNASSPDGTTTFDELRDYSGNSTTNSTYGTATRYSLYWDNNTPNDLSDDTLIQTVNYGANTTTYDMRWDQMFTWDTSDYTGGNYRINVMPTSGSSENGYNLRAGPPHTATDYDTQAEDAAWGTKYGSKSGIPVITATGNLEMNFNTDGTVNITLGYVAKEGAGGKLYINKFDTDVGAKSIVYTCDTLPGQTFAGTLAADGTWKLDTISLPANYTGGTWKAKYQASTGDTSVWTMSYSNYVPGTPGIIRLVE